MRVNNHRKHNKVMSKSSAVVLILICICLAASCNSTPVSSTTSPASTGAPVAENTTVSGDITNEPVSPLQQITPPPVTLSILDIIPELEQWTKVAVDIRFSASKFDEGVGLFGAVYAPADNTMSQQIVDLLMTLITTSWVEVEDVKLVGGYGVDNHIVTSASSSDRLLIENEFGRSVFNLSIVPDSQDSYYLMCIPVTELADYVTADNPNPDELPPVRYYEGQAASFSIIDLVQIQHYVMIDTADLPNVAIVFNSDSEEPERVLMKVYSTELRCILDGTIRVDGEFEIIEEPDYNIKIVFGDTEYLLDTTSGYFTREKDGEIVSSKLEDEWLSRVNTSYLGIFDWA